MSVYYSVYLYLYVFWLSTVRSEHFDVSFHDSYVNILLRESVAAEIDPEYD